LTGLKNERGARARSSLLNETDGFSLLELMVVILTLAILVTAVVFLWYNSSRGTDIKAAAQMIKEDLVKAAGMADSGTRVLPTRDPNAPRDRYRVVFKSSTSPANTYKIMKGAWVTPPEQVYPAGGWAWSDVVPKKGEYNRVVASVWIQAGGSSDIQVTPGAMFGTGSDKAVTFISAGSVIRAVSSMADNSPDLKLVSDQMTLTVSSTAGSITKTITISNLGDVQIQ
jgi:prepilin-type N-terminal cleavage/methylation domain-containing protein